MKAMRSLFAVFAALAPSVALAVPAQLTTQGRVLDSDGLPIDGTLEVDCNTDVCEINKNYIRYGAVSRIGPFAKACGACLNFNCALIVMPVTKLLLARINNAGKSYDRKARGANVVVECFNRYCTAPLQLAPSTPAAEGLAGA